MQASREAFFNKSKIILPLVNPSKRPATLSAAMTEDFKRTCDIDGASYLFVGELMAGYSIPVNGYLCINSSEIIGQLIAKNAPLTVCDIGAGAFGFEKNNAREFGDKVINYGISATSFGASLTENRCIGQNAEYLSEVFGENRFDLCFSRLTFVHFVDPIGSIIEAYKTLKPNGILFIDYFYVTGCEAYLPHLIPYLTELGYHVSGSAFLGKDNKLQSFIIQKTIDKPELQMPFHYYGYDEKLQRERYLPSKEFNTYCVQHNSHMFHHYRDGVNLLKTLNTDADFKAMIEDCCDLPGLFNHSNYELLNKEGRYFAILQVVGKSINSVADLIIRYELRVKQNKIFASIDKRLPNLVNTTEFYSGLCYLATDDSFLSLSVEDQQLIVEYHAVFDIVELQQAALIRAACERMGITLHEVEGSRSYNGHKELLFSSFNTQRLSLT